MQMCPFCDKVYDESEYTHCPYCSDETEDEISEEKYKDCPNCDSYMTWNGDCWSCVNCDYEDYSDEEDYDGIIER